METSTKLKLAKAKRNVQEKKALETRNLRQADSERLEKFIGDLSGLLSKGIQIEGLSAVGDVVSRIEKFGQDAADLVGQIQSNIALIPDLSELRLPDSIELKSVTDDLLISTLRELGDQNELIQKLQQLDQAVVLLASALEKDQSPGQTPEEYQPVRIVLGREGSLKFLENWPMPGFNSGQSNGLTDAQLRASPVPVSASIDTTGLATSTNQDTGNGLLQQIEDAVDGLEALVGSTNTKLDTLTTAVATIITKATDAYSICAISDDGTYKYFFFEDAALNYYVMRKTLASSVFAYTKGVGGYSTVYVSSSAGPSGSPTWASYGATF